MFKNVEKLKLKYNIEIPKKYDDFILKTDSMEYSGKKFKVKISSDNNFFKNIYDKEVEFEINHFLKESEYSSADLFDWHLLKESEWKDYLTIAFCIYDEEIAIKVRGNDKGKIVLITPEHFDDDCPREIIEIADNFTDFLNMII